jgi:hypothetical protein
MKRPRTACSVGITALLLGCSATPASLPREDDAGEWGRPDGLSRPVSDAGDAAPSGATSLHDAGSAAPTDAGQGSRADASLWDPSRPFEPSLAQNPWSASRGFATQHGDTGASDTSPLPGPGAGKVVSSPLNLLAACPSILPLTSGLLIVVCTQISNQTPAVYLVDPSTMTTLASHELAKGDLFGGVYPYLDQQDQLVVVDGANDLLRIGATSLANGTFSLTVRATRPLAPAITEHCGSPTCDSVVGLTPDYAGRVWFASASGLVGVVAQSGELQVLALPSGEQIANSIASSPEGVAVVTDQALYLLRASEASAPEPVFRAPYDRGIARKPGQLSWGSGSTPTFFGPHTGSEYVAITDNARPTMNLLVYRSTGSGQPVCSPALPAHAGDGSENSPIGAGRSVFVTGTFGYPYPALPRNAGASVPASAALSGGMARVDVAADESGCELVWTNRVHSAAVPKLSLSDGSIYTIERKPFLADGVASPLDGYAYTVIDPRSGAVIAQQELPGLADTMQLAGTIGSDRALYQGTISGLVKLLPAPPP